jgi:hypothetical protein
VNRAGTILTRAVACALALALSVEAHAQTTPPPPMPAVPDEPLPEWHPPARRSLMPIFLTVSPELVQAQKMRQAGMTISATGWLAVFAAGIMYPQAVDQNSTLSNLHVTGVDQAGNTLPSTTFEPWREDLRNRLEAASLSCVIIGGAMAIGGFVLFTVGQWKISSYHKRHLKEPLPSLSGY